MSWNSTWPVGTLSVKTNSPTGRQNTNYIKTALQVNHFFDEANLGKHKKLTLVALAADPTPAADSAVILYSKNVTVGATTGTDLYIAASTTGGASQIKTKVSQYSLGALTTASTGFSYIPGNGASGVVLMQWGSVIIASGGISSQTVTFPLAFKTGNVPWSIQLTLQCSDSRAFKIRNSVGNIPTESDFKFAVDTGAAGIIYWTAIGLAP